VQASLSFHRGITALHSFPIRALYTAGGFAECYVMAVQKSFIDGIIGEQKRRAHHDGEQDPDGPLHFNGLCAGRHQITPALTKAASTPKADAKPIIYQGKRV